MGINVTNPKTPLEKADAAANLLEQMFLAHQCGDAKRLRDAYNKAQRILADLVVDLDKSTPS